MNKNKNIKVKIRKYSGASSIDLDHIKPSLRKATEQIIIHAGSMNDISNDTNYLRMFER